MRACRCCLCLWKRSIPKWHHSDQFLASRRPSESKNPPWVSQCQKLFSRKHKNLVANGHNAWIEAQCKQSAVFIPSTAINLVRRLVLYDGLLLGRPKAKVRRGAAQQLMWLGVVLQTSYGFVMPWRGKGRYTMRQIIGGQRPWNDLRKLENTFHLVSPNDDLLVCWAWGKSFAIMGIR